MQASEEDMLVAFYVIKFEFLSITQAKSSKKNNWNAMLKLNIYI